MSRMNVTIDPVHEMVVPLGLIQDLRTVAFENLLLVGLYPFYACVYFSAVYSLCKDGLRSKANKINLGVTSAIFALTTVYLVCDLLLLISSFDSFFVSAESSSLARAFDIEQLAFATFATTIVIGDGVILWRAATVCAWPRWARILSAFIVIAQAVAWIVGNLYNVALVSEIVTLGISLVTTVAISRKAWIYRRMFRDKMAVISRRSALENILSILTETGIAYSILWVVYIPSHLSYASTTGTFHQVVSNVMTIAAPLYPTLIVIIVARHKSQLETHQLTSIEPLTIPDSERLDLQPRPEDPLSPYSIDFDPYGLAMQSEHKVVY